MKNKKSKRILRKLNKVPFTHFSEKEIPIAVEILSCMSKADMTTAGAQMLLEKLSKTLPMVSRF